MKKNLLAGFMALTVCLGLLPVTVPAAAPGEDVVAAELAAAGEGITVEGIKGGQIRFSSSTGKIIGCDAGVTKANIPQTINGVRVTGILSYAFEGCTGLTGVTIPKSVTSIGRSAFSQCTNLKTVTIPGHASLDDCAWRIRRERRRRGAHPEPGGADRRKRRDGCPQRQRRGGV